MISHPSFVERRAGAVVRSFAAFSKVNLIAIVVLTLVPSQALDAQTKVNISSLQELRDAIQRSNQTIVMKPGRYALTELPEKSRNLLVSGSNNTIDLSGVYVSVPVGSTRAEHISMSGSDNLFQGGTFEDLYESGLDQITDFSAYNKDRRNLANGLRGNAVFGITGDNNTVTNTKLIVRGSFPYGYGSIYGIGAENAFGLNKRCGLVVKGKRNIVDGCEIQQRAFGHGIYIQSPAEETVVKNCLVEGRMRPSKDLYQETDPDDLPVRSNYKIRNKRDQNDGPPIPKDTMIPLSEDGIRVYTNGGSVTVENCTVKMMRGGIRLYLASGGTVSNCTVIDCGLTNFNLPTRGQINGSTGNFAYGPVLDFPGNKSGQTIQLTIAPSPHIVGPHNIADIAGNSHTLIFRRLPGPIDTKLRPIVVTGSKSTIRNETEYPIMLEASATKNTIYSFGPVTDRGSGNTVKRIEQDDAGKGERESRDNQFRVWESRDGAKLLAKLVAKKGSSVTLRQIDGAQVTGRLRDLSKADRKYVADQGKAPLRTWTSTVGSKIEARLVRRKGDSVVLEKTDGSNLTVPLKKLSKVDQQYVNEN